MACPVCHRVIAVEACERRPNDPGDHDPAYHVAQAYHIPDRKGDCQSCGEAFPCSTREEYA